MRKVYWWKGVVNFGDTLTHTLLNQLLVKHAWARPADADLILCGSILEHMPRDWAGTVMGAGKLHENSAISLDGAEVLALRGPLSARGIRGDYALGDPGLLASRLVPLQPARYDLGVIPHWSDTELTKRFAYGRVISPMHGAIHVITEIARCKRIVSSSLHGIIVADSYGIERQAEIFSQASSEGGAFKFVDYAASLGVKPSFGELISVDRSVVETRQRELADVLASL